MSKWDTPATDVWAALERQPGFAEGMERAREDYEAGRFEPYRHREPFPGSPVPVLGLIAMVHGSHYHLVAKGHRLSRAICRLVGHKWGDWGSGMDEPDGGRMCRRCWRVEWGKAEGLRAPPLRGTSGSD